jgi:plastocyanin
MKRLALVFGILVLFMAPAAALAGYGYPSGGGPSMGGGGTSGGNSGGGVSIGGGPAMGGGGNAMGGSGDVTIVDFAFQPGSVSVPAGSTVTWRNTGNAPHTVTAFNGAFDSGTLSPGGSFSETFSAPGVFMYHCEIHPNMVGTVQVTAS